MDDGANILLEAVTKCADERGCTDILVNGRELWVDVGQGISSRPFPDSVTDEDCRRLAVRLAAQAGRRLDQSCPIVDARMKQGWRLHAVISPVASPQTLISIRIPRQNKLALSDFVRFGWEMWVVDAIRALVEKRLNVVISGGTGSGKTTLLAAALNAVPTDERIVCIEEVPELMIRHPHCVYLYERQANIQGAGAIKQSELVRAAMRMRPDRLVLGECRGGEIRDVMTAFNTGHEGSWVTIHANSAANVPARLLALGALSGMNTTAVALQASSAFDVVIHIERTGDGTRWVQSIALLNAHEGKLGCTLIAERCQEGKLSCTPTGQEFFDRLHRGMDRRND